MSGSPPEEDRFRANILDLTDLMHELAGMCWDAGCEDVNPVLILAAKAYLSGYDKIKLITTFIQYSYIKIKDSEGNIVKNEDGSDKTYWDEIRNRNEDFFVKHAASIFQHLPIKSDNIATFKVFFTSKDEDGEYIIIQEDRDAIWDIFGSLVKICIKYIHRKRGLELVSTDKGMRPVYTVKGIFPGIKVRAEAKKWDIQLEMPEPVKFS